MLRRGAEIKFSRMCELTGEMLKNTKGVIVGHAKEIKKMWPEEYSEVADPVYLVKFKDVYDNTFHGVIYPEEIIKEEK